MIITCFGQRLTGSQNAIVRNGVEKLNLSAVDPTMDQRHGYTFGQLGSTEA